MRFLKEHEMIVHIGEVLSAEVCREAIQLFEADPNKAAGRMYNVVGERETMSAKISEDLAVPEVGEWQEIGTIIKAALAKAYQAFIEASPAFQRCPLDYTRPKLQKSPCGKGKFDWHMDALSPRTTHRQIALICYLNNVAEGGETEFFHQNYKLKPQTGLAVLFPPFWTHLHRGHVPISGDKYILTSFACLDVDRFIEGERAQSTVFTSTGACVEGND